MRFSLLSLFLLAVPIWADDVPLTVKGDLSVVKVDVIVKHTEDRTVVKSLPFTISAPGGEAFYFWSYPAGVTAVDKGQVLEIVTAPKGELVVSVKALTVDWTAKKFLNDFGSIKVIIGGVIPPTPPTPDPPKPDPNPPTPPAPIPSAGLRVLIVYETADLGKLPIAQANVLTSKTLRDYLDSRCVNGTDSKTKEWRIWDKDVSTANVPKLWQNAMARPRQSLPWITISNGAAGFEGPLPTNTDDTITLIKKWANP